MPLRKAFYRRMGQVDGFAADEVDNAIALIEVTLTALIQRMADLGYGPIWEDDLPEMTAWFARIKARPSFATTFYANTNVSEKYPQFFTDGA
jgi:glutathione S-transferase